jgi:hypothetical protein
MVSPEATCEIVIGLAITMALQRTLPLSNMS